MCGRYNITDNPAVHLLLNELGINIGPLPSRYNIAPTEAALTIIGGERPALHEMRWWFTPFWSDAPSTRFSMFNAKSETITTSKAFQGAFKYRRGIVPASSFIEWKTEGDHKQPYLITNEEQCLFMAAVWEEWNEELLSCAIVTTEACDTFKNLHKRQPVLLTKEEAMTWLYADPIADKHQLNALMQPADLSDYLVAPIDTTIGNSRIKSKPELLEGLRPLTHVNP